MIPSNMVAAASPRSSPRSRLPPKSDARAESIGTFNFVDGLHQDAATRRHIKKSVMRDYIHKKHMRSLSFLRPHSCVTSLWGVDQQGISTKPSHRASPKPPSLEATFVRSTDRARTRLRNEHTSKLRPFKKTGHRVSMTTSPSSVAIRSDLNALTAQALSAPQLPHNHTGRFNPTFPNPAVPKAGLRLSPVADSQNPPSEDEYMASVLQTQILDQSTLLQSPPALYLGDENLASEDKGNVRESLLAYKLLPQEFRSRSGDQLSGSTLRSSPQTMMGAGRMDPFAVYPIKCGMTEHALCDFHTFSLGDMLYGFSPTAPLCHFRAIYCTAMQDAAVFHLTLAFAAFRYSSLLGGNLRYEIAALSHKVEGIRLVNERISDPIKGASNANMQAAIILGGIEARLGNAQGAKDHLLGLKRMVAMRGGLDEFHDDLLMIWQASWIDLSHSDKLGMDYMAFNDYSFDRFKSLNTTLPDASLTIPDRSLISEHETFRICCQEFTHYLREFEALSWARKAVPPESPVFGPVLCASVEYAFRPGSPLHRILSPPVGLHLNSQHSFYSQDVYRLACLFYIHSTLYSYRHLPLRTDVYIAHLQSQIVWNNLDKSHSVEGLSYIMLWVLLAERDDKMQEKLERTRLVLRLMKVSRRLGAHSWRLMEKVLFQWLCPALPSLELALLWDPEQIRGEAIESLAWHGTSG